MGISAFQNVFTRFLASLPKSSRTSGPLEPRVQNKQVFSAARVYYTTFQKGRGLHEALEKKDKEMATKGRLVLFSLSKEGGGSGARVRSWAPSTFPLLKSVLPASPPQPDPRVPGMESIQKAHL